MRRRNKIRKLLSIEVLFFVGLIITGAAQYYF
jgi:hypothetical protein